MITYADLEDAVAGMDAEPGNLLCMYGGWVFDELDDDFRARVAAACMLDCSVLVENFLDQDAHMRWSMSMMLGPLDQRDGSLGGFGVLDSINVVAASAIRSESVKDDPIRRCIDVATSAADPETRVRLHTTQARDGHWPVYVVEVMDVSPREANLDDV